MAVDLSKIKPGDEVTVRLLVSEVTARGLRAEGLGDVFHVFPDCIVSHTPKAMVAGERVVFVGIHGEPNLQGDIIATHNGSAWVSWDAAFPHPVVALSSLERV